VQVPGPDVWLRPPNQRRETEAVKPEAFKLLSVSDGDLLTLLNVY
jgi:hypothetical protein